MNSGLVVFVCFVSRIVCIELFLTLSGVTTKQAMFILLYSPISFIFSYSVKLTSFSQKCLFSTHLPFPFKFEIILTEILHLTNHTGLLISDLIPSPMGHLVSAEVVSPCSQDLFMKSAPFIWISESLREARISFSVSAGKCFVFCLQHLLCLV